MPQPISEAQLLLAVKTRQEAVDRRLAALATLLSLIEESGDHRAIRTYNEILDLLNVEAISLMVIIDFLGQKAEKLQDQLDVERLVKPSNN